MDDDGDDDLEKFIALIILEVTVNSISLLRQCILFEEGKQQRDTGTIRRETSFSTSLI